MPDEITELHHYGITRLYSPDDGRTLGLQGMINDLLQQADFPTGQLDVDKWRTAIHEAYTAYESPITDYRSPITVLRPEIKNWVTHRALARLISAVENEPDLVEPIMDEVHARLEGLAHPPVLGITGTSCL